QFYATGSDASGFQLSIDDSDITANLGQPIQEITILDYRAHYSSTTGTQSCDFDYGWFYFDLTVTGGVANGLSIDEGCDDDYIDLDVTGFENMTFTSVDGDNAADTVHLFVILEITYETPDCTSLTVASSNVVDDCEASQFSVNVDITEVGDAIHITNGIDTWAISGTGVVSVGPFNVGSSQTLTVVHSDVACNLSLGNFTFVCPPSNTTCADATTVSCGQTINGTSVGSTGTPEGNECTMGNNGVWYAFEGTGGDITVT